MLLPQRAGGSCCAEFKHTENLLWPKLLVFCPKPPPCRRGVLPLQHPFSWRGCPKLHRIARFHVFKGIWRKCGWFVDWYLKEAENLIKKHEGKLAVKETDCKA